MKIFACLQYQMQRSALTLSYFKLQFRIVCLLYGNRRQLFWAWWKLVIPCHSDRTGKILKCGVCHQSINWCSVELGMGSPNSCTELHDARQIRFNPRSSQYAFEYYAQECFHSCVVKVKQRSTLQKVRKHENWTLLSPHRSGVRCRYIKKNRCLLSSCSLL